MALDTNPFVVLSYVSGPALLTNATSLILLSTTNRFARAIDRSRHLTALLGKLSRHRELAVEADELRTVGRRIRLIGLSISGFYLAAAMFALATVTSILGAVHGAGAYPEMNEVAKVGAKSRREAVGLPAPSARSE